ncbi:MAG: 50S ribosomal protein L3 [Chlamydiae bacterium RIFCSPHIGHO2_12_FULL_44_59]|nr:MAG: 50S ribosomal protein L3 [Chlamydiae bacterium RIFCSPHIGHO2_01_FULL_44_39]OGN58577.1 MAG: 50S ribosomal protein L3 [Chlamydiae bacterium RIFCSPHIGHO2_02_FULL_45_9]OGN60525.1 MAG: 50S ribosomal protein L3 [Chlamydiae bacterium RIFCSPHIGHO2_12_FULL_44_59]OGN65980.1 MAG: 50S ribosomal protein L3 [Chlamydiae bacterium RIFCSPLOWO2_01_FULL_44_52]OGN68795.1 MAG: 50S ribosomal protein L3 [Chlamydiae bacterium RIFCSPLOWO2_02_FULL_45_22]OGN70435.1 MAG: 50S ribosomal protein L3 [Chlamydiae bacter
MPLTLIGQKKGMVQVFDKDGKRVVCTVIQAEPNTVLQIKRKETDGYNGIQLCGITKTESQIARTKKPLKGHYAKHKVAPHRVIRESLLDEVDNYQVGQKLDASIFADVEFVDVEGVSKGKGFQGVMKLYNMAGGPAAHGSGFHRHMGSTGMRSTPGRCFPGGKRASRMGGDRKTVQNLRVVAIKGDLLLVEGAVPGARSGIVYIRKASKKG